MRIILGHQDTKKNNEDFALTPYIFLVRFKGAIVNIIGLGFCWGYYSFYVALGRNIPNNFPTIINHDNYESYF